MPTYRYACATCTNQFDQYQTYAEDALTDCPTCEGTVRRVIQPVGVVFKGSGWYLTDSRKPEKSGETMSEGKTEGKADGEEKAAGGSTDGKAGDDSKAEAPSKPETTTKKSEATPSTKSVESKRASTVSS